MMIQQNIKVLQFVGLFLLSLFSSEGFGQNQDSLLKVAEMPYDYRIMYSFEDRMQVQNYSLRDCTMVNFTDEVGKKQGYWRYTAAMKPKAGYDSTALVEECMFRDNRRNGYSTFYHPNGNVKSFVSFKYNRPYGYYVKFDSLNNLVEEGFWKRSKYEHLKKWKNGCVVEEKIWSEGARKHWLFEEECDCNFYGEIVRVEYHLNSKVVEQSRCWNRKSNRSYDSSHSGLDNEVVLLNTLIDSISLNYTDAAGRKQGFWKIYGTDKPAKSYCDSCLIVEGTYKDNRKHGKWWFYRANGVLKSIISYKYNRPNGDYWKYDSLGVILDSGTWKAGGYYGQPHRSTYEYSHTAGPNKELIFSSDDINRIQIYNRDTIDFKTIVYNGDDLPKSGLRDGNNDLISGFYRVFHKSRDLFMEGRFEDGKFILGKRYLYDKNGLLYKIEIYKKGEYFGDGVVEF